MNGDICPVIILNVRGNVFALRPFPELTPTQKEDIEFFMRGLFDEEDPIIDPEYASDTSSYALALIIVDEIKRRYGIILSFLPIVAEYNVRT